MPDEDKKDAIVKKVVEKLANSQKTVIAPPRDTQASSHTPSTSELETKPKTKPPTPKKPKKKEG